MFAHVVEVPTPEGPTVRGDGHWFRNFSTWAGVHGIYLEDLYVTRARGAGTATGVRLGMAGAVATLAEECVTKGYTRLAWSGAELEHAVDRLLRVTRRGRPGRVDDLPLTGDPLAALAARVS